MGDLNGPNQEKKHFQEIILHTNWGEMPLSSPEGIGSAERIRIMHLTMKKQID